MTHQLGFEGSDISSLLRDALQIRLGYTYTQTEWEATPGEGFRGLHCFERLLLACSATVPQTPNYLALARIIVDNLLPRARLDSWQNDTAVPAATREYLTRSLELLQSGQRYALKVDYMPLDCISSSLTGILLQ